MRLPTQIIFGMLHGFSKYAADDGESVPNLSYLAPIIGAGIGGLGLLGAAKRRISMRHPINELKQMQSQFASMRAPNLAASQIELPKRFQKSKPEAQQAYQKKMRNMWQGDIDAARRNVEQIKTPGLGTLLNPFKNPKHTYNDVIDRYSRALNDYSAAALQPALHNRALLGST